MTSWCSSAADRWARGWKRHISSHRRCAICPFGKHVAILTDARFSGVSTGACIGHVSPEALAGGPIGKLRDGDLVQIVVDRVKLEGSVDLVGENGVHVGPMPARRMLAAAPVRTDLARDPALPDDTRLWAALQDASGGTWGGCVFDVDAIVEVLGGWQEGSRRMSRT